MSREVTGTDRNATQPSRPRWLARSPRLRVVRGLLAAVAVGAVGTVAAVVLTSGADRSTSLPGPAPTAVRTPDGSGSPPPPTAPRTGDLTVGDGLVATLLATGRQGADLTHVEVTVVLDNSLPTSRELVAVEVLGLGPAVVQPADGVVLPAARGQARLRATISADCRVRQDPERPDVSVRVTQRRAGRVVTELAGLDPVASVTVLDPLCPPVTQGLAVAITQARTADGGPVTVRIVNHGRRSALVTPRATPDAGRARLVSDPPLPYDLGPGEALFAVLDVTLGDATSSAGGSTTGRTAPVCPGNAPDVVADALFLEAETRDGFTAVTGFPTAALTETVTTAVERAGCPGRG